MVKRFCLKIFKPLNIRPYYPTLFFLYTPPKRDKTKTICQVISHLKNGSHATHILSKKNDKCAYKKTKKTLVF